MSTTPTPESPELGTMVGVELVRDGGRPLVEFAATMQGPHGIVVSVTHRMTIDEAEDLVAAIREIVTEARG